MIDRKKYTVVGYSNCDSTEPVYAALSDLFLGSEEHEYTAHEMWVMAEIRGRGHLSYLLAIQSVTILSKKEIVTADSKGYFVGPKLCKLT